jgi:transposase
MHAGRTVFAQLMDFVPHPLFQQCVTRYHGDHRVRRFSCWDQFLVMAFAQLTYRESLRDIEACLRAMPDRLYHAGIRGAISRSTLADANERRDWRIYQDLGMALIAQARVLYAGDPFALAFEDTVFAFDATMIELCLGLFPWAMYRPGEGGIKLHTLLDLRGAIPTVVRITPAQLHDVNGLDFLPIEPGAMYVFDRGYLDFRRLYRIAQTPASFVIRGRKRHSLRRLASHPVDRTTGLICDQRVLLTRPRPARAYPMPLRRIRLTTPACGARPAHQLTLFTNHFGLPALTITDLYRRRWQVELFFKWIKHHLRIKAFYGTSLNAVQTQVWIALTVYLLVTIVVKRLGIQRDLHAVLQILSLTLFEKIPLQQVLSELTLPLSGDAPRNQLLLFDF